MSAKMIKPTEWDEIEAIKEKDRLLLEEVDLSDCPLTTLPAYAFHRCANLRSVVLPKGLKVIEEMAFDGCEKLQTLEIPDSVEIILGSPASSNGIKHLTLPASLKRFDYVSELESLDMSRCNNIENFGEVYGIKTVYLPSLIETIEDGKLRGIDYCFAPPTLTAIGAIRSVGIICSSPVLSRISDRIDRSLLTTTSKYFERYQKLVAMKNLTRTFLVKENWDAYQFMYLR